MGKSIKFMLWCFAIHSLLEMHLQNGSVLCICSSASILSAVSSLGLDTSPEKSLVKHQGVELGWYLERWFVHDF